MKENIKSRHVFMGMGRGAHPINQDADRLWDAHNIRLTDRSGESLLSVTNERGTTLLASLTLSDVTVTAAYYVGHAIMDDWLVILMHYETGDGDTDVIYRVDMSADGFSLRTEDNDSGNIEILYRGDLGLDHAHPAEMVTDYEASLIRKVYWTDGINRPRLINIAKPELRDAEYDYTDGYSAVYTDAPFDFVQDLSLGETVTVTRLTSKSGGIFPAGVVQYALTYYHKYQQETNFFHVSGLYGISYPDRGADAEDSLSVAFQIKVTGVETDRFDYLRVYSIIRTSIDGEPLVKRVIDIDLKEIDGTTVTFTDTNTTGETVDASHLLFLGGKDVTAGCVEIKDGTLFLGDITYNRKPVTEIEIDGTALPDYLQANATIRRDLATVSFDESDYSGNGKFYVYQNQLGKITRGFKCSETYRIGMQFQYRTGEWSEPVYIGDYEMTSTNKPYVNVSDSAYTMKIPRFLIYLNSSDFWQTLYDEGYRRSRALVVFPGTHERDVLAQGIACPTVFQASARDKNAPFAFSSWFLRPQGISYQPTGQGNTGLSGSIVEWEHFHPLTSGLSTGAEIQNMTIAEDYNSDVEEDSVFRVLADYDFWAGVTGSSSVTFDTDLSANYLTLANISAGIEEDAHSCYGMWFVDQSVCTLHSPDIEFDDTVKKVIASENPNIGLRIVGVVPFNSCYGDIDISLDSVQADPDAGGVMTHAVSNTGNGGAGLVAGLFFEDGMVDDFEDRIDIAEYNKDTSDHGRCSWMVYPWHREGSLNNDIARPQGKAITGMEHRTAEMRKKRMSNIRYSDDTLWVTNKYSTDNMTLSISGLTLFDSDSMSVVKLKDTYNANGDIIYYGNVDYYNPSYTPFKLVTGNKSEYTIYVPNSGTLTYQGSINGTDTYLYVTVSSATYNNDGTVTIQLSVVSGSYSGYSFGGQEFTVEGSTTNNRITTEDVTLTGTNSDGETALFLFEISSRSVTVYATQKTYSGTPLDFSYTGALGYNTFYSSTDDSGDIGDYYRALVVPKEGVRMRYKSTAHAVFAMDYVSEDYCYRKPLPIIENESVTEDYNIESGTVIDDQWWVGLPTGSQNQNMGIYRPTVGGGDLAYVYNDDRSEGLVEPSASYLWMVEIFQEEVTNKFGGTSSDALTANTWLPAGRSEEITSSTRYLNVYCEWGDTWYERYDCLKTYPFSDDDSQQMVEIGSFMVETRVNIDGRYDRNRGLTSNLNISPRNFNLINDVYTQKDNFFTYQIMDSDWYKTTRFPSQVIWTNAKTPGASIDSWTNLHMATALDLDGSHGQCHAIKSFNGALLGFQDTSVTLINFNSQALVSGTAGAPLEIASSMKVTGFNAISTTVGCQDRFAMVASASALYFVDGNNGAAYALTTGGNTLPSIANLSEQKHLRFWFKGNKADMEWRQYDDSDSVNGMRLYWDPHYQDIYFVPGIDGDGLREALCFSETLAEFTSFMSYGGSVMVPHDGRFYALAYTGDVDDVTSLGMWECFSDTATAHNSFFGVTRPFSLSFVCNENPVMTKIFDTMEMRVDMYDHDGSDMALEGDTWNIATQDGQPFDYIQVRNEYQDTGVVACDAQLLRKKFRVWRFTIPRGEDSRERIRNPWCLITIGKRDPGTSLTILHDLLVCYSPSGTY